MDAKRERDLRQRYGLGAASVADGTAILTEAQQFRLEKIRELNRRFRLGMDFDEMLAKAQVDGVGDELANGEGGA